MLTSTSYNESNNLQIDINRFVEQFLILRGRKKGSGNSHSFKNYDLSNEYKEMLQTIYRYFELIEIRWGMELCIHSNSIINGDIFVQKLQCTLCYPANFCLHFEFGTLADTWVHYEDLILHFCKVSKPLEFITFQLVIHCF